MFPRCSSVSLLVLLGALITSGNPIMPKNVTQLLDSISDTLGLKVPEIGSKPLFTHIIRSVDAKCQMRDDLQLLNATLDVYSRMFSSKSSLLDLLPDAEREKVKQVFTCLQQSLEDLKRNLRPLGRNKDDDIRKLNQIQVDDPVIQRKALAEFNLIYKLASRFGSKH